MAAYYNDIAFEQMRELLEELHDRYNNPDFIEADPISVPHSFSSPLDREIAGFMAATIAWGNRQAIVKSSFRMMRYMDNSPADFVRNASQGELDSLHSFVHRTFNGSDFRSFVLALRAIVERWGSVGNYFEQRYLECSDMRKVLSMFYHDFFSVEHDPHCRKHLSSIDKGAACKRLCMYLRWFVRSDDRGVDFGQWTKIPMSALYMPLDIHTGRMGRSMALLQRKQSDWRAVEELTASLREFSADDPVRYDYALFGLGIDEKRRGQL
mgnify:CR=1 FL=1